MPFMIYQLTASQRTILTCNKLIFCEKMVCVINSYQFFVVTLKISYLNKIKVLLRISIGDMLPILLINYINLSIINRHNYNTELASKF